MAKPTLYGPGYSTYARAARLAMEEKGVDYDLVEVDFIAGDMPDEHLAPIFAYFAGTPESKDIMDDKPGLNAWWQRMQARQSMAKTQPQLG